MRSTQEHTRADSRADMRPNTREDTAAGPWWTSRRARLLVAAGLFVVFTLMAIGPLKAWDLALHRPWADLFTPNRKGFLRSTADKVAGQQVNTTVLVLVAAFAVWRSRCWNPLLYVVGATVGFYVVGLTKIAFSRSSTAQGMGADFFRGQVGHIEKFVMSYPSGHSSEAILMYGTAYAILLLYGGLGARALSLLRTTWALITANAVFVSFYLGYHWLTDLVGGLLLGWILLEIVLGTGKRLPTLALARADRGASRPGPRRDRASMRWDVGGASRVPVRPVCAIT